MISSSLKSASVRQHIEQDPTTHQELQTHPQFHLPWRKLWWGACDFNEHDSERPFLYKVKFTEKEPNQSNQS